MRGLKKFLVEFARQEAKEKALREDSVMNKELTQKDEYPWVVEGIRWRRSTGGSEADTAGEIYCRVLRLILDFGIYYEVEFPSGSHAVLPRHMLRLANA